jgi:hypothetical protein
MSTEKLNGKTHAQNPVESSDLFGDVSFISGAPGDGDKPESQRFAGQSKRGDREQPPPES